MSSLGKAMANECVDGSCSLRTAESSNSLHGCVTTGPCCNMGHQLHQQQRPRNTCDVCSNRGTEYRCTPCDYDLCVQCYHKAKAKIMLGPCCNNLHRLVSHIRKRNICDECGSRGTQYRCPEGCDYDMCGRCFEAKAKARGNADYWDGLSEGGEEKSEQTSTAASAREVKSMYPCECTSCTSDHASTAGSIITLDSTAGAQAVALAASSQPSNLKSLQADTKPGFARLWKSVWQKEELRTDWSDSSGPEEIQKGLEHDLQWAAVTPTRGAIMGEAHQSTQGERNSTATTSWFSLA